MSAINKKKVHRKRHLEQSNEPPKLIPGRIAVCCNCGYLGEDFNRCQRCKKKLPDDVKSITKKKKANPKMPTPEVTTTLKTTPKPDTPTNKPPEQPKEATKSVPAQVAVCSNCGYLGEDFDHCQRCKKKLPDDVKIVSITKLLATTT